MTWHNLSSLCPFPPRPYPRNSLTMQGRQEGFRDAGIRKLMHYLLPFYFPVKSGYTSHWWLSSFIIFMGLENRLHVCFIILRALATSVKTAQKRQQRKDDMRQICMTCQCHNAGIRFWDIVIIYYFRSQGNKTKIEKKEEERKRKRRSNWQLTWFFFVIKLLQCLYNNIKSH